MRYSGDCPSMLSRAMASGQMCQALDIDADTARDIDIVPWLWFRS